MDGMQVHSHHVQRTADWDQGIIVIKMMVFSEICMLSMVSRQVQCQNSMGAIVADEMCGHTPMPNRQTVCPATQQCSNFEYLSAISTCNFSLFLHELHTDGYLVNFYRYVIVTVDNHKSLRPVL